MAAVGRVGGLGRLRGGHRVVSFLGYALRRVISFFVYKVLRAVFGR